MKRNFTRWASAFVACAFTFTILLTSNPASADPTQDLQNAYLNIYPETPEDMYEVRALTANAIAVDGTGWAVPVRQALDDTFVAVAPKQAATLTEDTQNFTATLEYYMKLEGGTVPYSTGDFDAYLAAHQCAEDPSSPIGWSAGCQALDDLIKPGIKVVLDMAPESPQKQQALILFEAADTREGRMKVLLRHGALATLPVDQTMFLVLDDGDYQMTMVDPTNLEGLDDKYALVADRNGVNYGNIDEETGALEQHDGTSVPISQNPEAVMLVGGMSHIPEDEWEDQVGNTVCLELKDGSIVCGKVTEVTDDEIVLVDPEGNEHRIPRDEVVNMWSSGPANKDDKKSKKPDRKKGDKDKADKGSKDKKSKVSCDAETCDPEEAREMIKAIRQMMRDCVAEGGVPRYTLGISIGNEIGSNKGLRLIDLPFLDLNAEVYALPHRLLSFRAGLGYGVVLGASENGLPGTTNPYRHVFMPRIGMSVGHDFWREKATVRLYTFVDASATLNGEPRFGPGVCGGLGVQVVPAKRSDFAFSAETCAIYRSTMIQPDDRPGDSNPGIPNLDYGAWGIRLVWAWGGRVVKREDFGND